MPRQNQIQFRKGTGSEWTNSNPVLNSGEPGYETDSNRLKVGLGLNWDDTSYIGTDSLITTVYNKTGSTISGFNVVHISGGHGNVPAITLSIASSEMTSSKTFGITINNIPTNSSGLVITNGRLKQVDTNQFGTNKEGSALWLSPTVSGGITLTKPYAPNHSVFVGTILRSHNTQGVVEVKIQNGYELEELHNVATTGATNGQFLQYNSGSGLWVPSSSGNFSSLTINNNRIVTGTGLTNYIVKWSSNSGVSDSSLYDDGSQAIRFGYNNAGYVYISDDWSGGELGLVTSDQQSIAINYPSDGSFRYGGGPVGGENIVVTSGGDVGIGTAYPSGRLHVIGSGIFSNGIVTNDIRSTSTLNINNNIDDTNSIYIGNANTPIAVGYWEFSGDSLTNSAGTVFCQYVNGWQFDNDNLNNNAGTINASNAYIANYLKGSYGNFGTMTSDVELPFVVQAESGMAVNGAALFKDYLGNDKIFIDSLCRIGIGTLTPSNSIDVVGTGRITGDWTVGGNLVVNGSTFVTNVDTVTIEDPIITLGISSGNIVTNNTLDRGLALVRGTGLTAFMGWDTSASQFVMLSSGVASNSSGNYDAGTYGNLQINNLNASRVYSSRLDLSDGINDAFISAGAEGDTRFVVSSSGALGVGSNMVTVDTAPFYISSNGFVQNGTWNASTIAVNKGGTGRTTYSNGQILIGSGTSLVANTLTAGTGISITNGSGTITINTSGLQTLLTNPVTGTGTNGKLPKWSSSSGLTDSILSESSSVINIAGSFNSTSDDTYLSFDANARRIGITKKGGFTGKFTYGSGSLFAIAQSNASTIEATNTFTDRLVVDTSGNVGIGTATPGYKLQVSGSFGATTKSFRIDHPSKHGWSLEYGSLESPYHGVRLTGRDKVIKGHGTVKLPDYLKDLIHNDESITIQLTNYKHGKILYVSNIDLQNDQFIVKADRAKSLGELEFFWTLTGVRKDVDHLVVEKEN